MSFSFNFLAANKAHAHAHLAQANVPIEMQRLCRDAVNNIRGDGPISVSASGHVCQSGGDYEVTTITLEIKPVRVESRVEGVVSGKATDGESRVDDPYHSLRRHTRQPHELRSDRRTPDRIPGCRLWRNGDRCRRSHDGWRQRASRLPHGPRLHQAATAAVTIRLQFVYCSDLGSRVIRWFSRGWPSHVDAVLPDGTLLGARSDAVGGKPPGVQIRPPGYEKWSQRETVVLNATPYQETMWLHWLREQVGKPYDKLGIVAFAFDRDWRSPESWFCSELQARALEVCGWFPKPLAAHASTITPRDLFLVLSPWDQAVVS